MQAKVTNKANRKLTAVNTFSLRMALVSILSEAPKDTMNTTSGSKKARTTFAVTGGPSACPIARYTFLQSFFCLHM
jgi:hypothetical protein